MFWRPWRTVGLCAALFIAFLREPSWAWLPDDGMPRKAGSVVPVDVAFDEPPSQDEAAEGKPIQVLTVSKIPKT